MIKVTGIVLTMVLMGVLTGCWHSSCEQPMPQNPPMNYKADH